MTSPVRHLTGRRLLAGALVGAVFVSPLALQTAAAEIDFYRDVYPILKANCIACHNKTTTKAELSMETPELMQKGGESGPGIIPGKSADSLIAKAAAHLDDLLMPPKKNKAGAVDLTPSELTLLRTWIDQGAKHSVQQTRPIVWQPLPPGVNPIYAVAMTQDGRFAACGRANQVFIYDLATRQFVTCLADHGGLAHRALVQSLAFSPDGVRLATGSFREVKIWRREKANVTSRMSDPALGAVVSTLSNDGTQILCADPLGALHLLEARSGKVTKTVPALNAAGVRRLSLSPDASTAAIYGTDATLSLWSLKDDRRIAAQTGVSGVRAMTWTHDGKTIVTAGDDGVVRIWALPGVSSGSSTLDAPRELKGATRNVTALEVIGNSDRLLAASEDGPVSLWSLAEGKRVGEFGIAGVLALASSRDGRQFAAGCADGAVRVWDLETAKQTIELRGGVEFSKSMAALDWEAAAQGLDLAFQTKAVTRIEAENKALDELLKKANETITDVKKILPEKQKAVPPATDAKLAAQKAADAVAALIAKAPEGKPEAALEKQRKEAQDKLTAALAAETSAIAAVTASEQHIKDAEAEVDHITAAKSQNSRAITAANAAITAAKQAQAKATADLALAKQAVAKGDARPLAVAFSGDAQSLAAVFSDGIQRVWAIASGIPIEQVAVGTGVTAASVVSSVDGGFVACNGDGATTRVSTAASWVLERVLGGGNADSPFVDRVNAVRFSPDGKTLATGGGEPSRSGDISLWDVASGNRVKTWPECHSDAVLSLDFSPDGKFIASGGADKIVRVTDCASGKPVNLFESHTHHVMGVAFRADGRVLASAGGDGVVLIWDMILGERKKKIEGWSKEVTSLQFIGATPQLITSAGNNLIRIVNDDGSQVRSMEKLPDFMQSAASSASADVVIGGGEDSFLRVWDGTNGKELAVFGAK